MFWKKDRDNEKKLMQMNDLLKKSFANVKRDTTHIFQWLNYFYKKIVEQEQMLKKLQFEVSYIPKTREDIKRIIDDYYSFESIMTKIRGLNDKIDELARNQQVSLESFAAHPTPLASQELQAGISHIEKRLEKLEQKKVSIKEKIMKRLTRNSKEYVKGMILSYIKKYGKISATQLKDMVVDEQNFCSKSSFYRLLEEVEELDEVGVIRQGKEKHYLARALKHI
ncbi:MAG: hypothetical protein AABX33_00955 [Nanoarchaeota archaeon]